MAESLSNVLKKGAQKIGDTASAGSTAAPLESGTAQYYLDQLKQVHDQYTPSAPPETKQALSEALAKAEELYKSEASKNEWLEVAQILGRAGTQFAAAQSGMKSGRNMGALDLGPSIDYGARTHQAAVNRAESSREAQALADEEHRTYKSGEDAKKADYDRASNAPEKGLSAALREEEIGRRENADNARFNRGLKADSDRDTRTNTAQQLHDLELQEKGLAAQLKARQALVNQIQTEDDLSGKSLSKMQEKYGQLAAQGDLDLQELQTEMETKTKPGRLNELTGGLIGTTNPDPAAQGALLKGKVDEVRNLLEGVRARRASLLQGAATSAPAEGTPPQQQQQQQQETPPPPKTIRVRGPSGTVVEFPAEIAAKYLSKPGYSEVK